MPRFLALLTWCATAFAAEPTRPNIVFIYSDDHAYQAISAYGDERKLIQTPNIDRIAREGMRFDRALVTNSICGPCRAVILTGKYSHRTPSSTEPRRRSRNSCRRPVTRPR